ncbi:MAG: transporter, family, alpha-ketoglutarate permease [Dactylosporangium sp.]|nr:transporter, family, alpha-ketoglutarate permease [Dactylosporangium sp.]
MTATGIMPTGPTSTMSTSPLRGLAAASVGNALEYFDWTTYAVFSLILAPRFFPHREPLTAVLATLAIFAVGFLFRPVGGLLFGIYADRRGRAPALALSVLLMAGGSLLIALSPTYSGAGLLAPVLLLVARAAQGLSAGGEAAAMTTYVVERAPTGRRGLHASAIFASTTVGTLAATTTALVLRGTLGAAQLAAWGWRVPFALGALAGLYGFVLRRRLAETPTFEGVRSRPARRPLAEAFRHNRAAMLRVAGLSAGATVTFYTFSIYLPSYAQRAHGVPATGSWWASVGAHLVFIAVLPAFGMLSDRIGQRPLLVVFGLGFAVLIPVLLRLVGSSAWSLFAVMTAALVLFACGAVAMPVVIAESLPPVVRSTGIGIPYSLTVALAGGSAPYLIEFLAARHLEPWYAGYAALLCLVTAVTALSARGPRVAVPARAASD